MERSRYYRRRINRQSIQILALSLTTALFFGVSLSLYFATRNQPVTTIQTVSERLIVKGEVSNIAKKVRPLIISIETSNRKPPSFKNSVFNEVSVGAGIIIRPDGYIVTNDHVVRFANKIKVKWNSKSYSARFIGVSIENDIAVIKIEEQNMPIATVKPLSDIKEGDLAVVVGNPLELSSSITAGIVNAVDRELNVKDKYEASVYYANLIQTDAEVNPGNSGGGLFDREGRLMGIITLLQITNDKTSKFGFAIPAEVALSEANKIIEQSKK